MSHSPLSIRYSPFAICYSLLANLQVCAPHFPDAVEADAEEAAGGVAAAT
jgi:hypothetical protein